MDGSQIPEYTTELQTGNLTRARYLEAARMAVEMLGWRVASADDGLIICQTDGNTQSMGECVTIKAEEAIIMFNSRASNEYYFAENQNYLNAELFQKAVASVIERNEEMEKRLKLPTGGLMEILVPSEKYLVTPVLIYINVLVFIIMVVAGVSFLTPVPHDLTTWGGNFRPLTITGQWWRLVTCMFVHGGITHLLMNMAALLYIGMFLEPMLGKFRFAAAYLLTGICASLTSVSMHAYVVSVGASGAIFGMYGLFLALLTTTQVEKSTRKTLLKSISFFVVYNLLYGFKGNIDNAAHIGGLISGIVIGYTYIPGLSGHHTLEKQFRVSALAALLVFVLSAATLHFLPNDLLAYDQKMKKFFWMESMALEVYKMNQHAPKEDILYNLKDRGIYYWNEDLEITNEISKLDLPEKIRQKNDGLKRYCQLRIKLYELLYKQVSEGNSNHQDEVNDLTAQISKIMEDVKAVK